MGDTVNTSARMCYTIYIPMKIRCSTSTYELIKDVKLFEFEEDWVDGRGLGLFKTQYIGLKK